MTGPSERAEAAGSRPAGEGTATGRTGAGKGSAGRSGGSDDADLLRRWAAAVAAELALDGVEVDIDRVLSLAGRAAHAVVRPAAPLTTFLVGYSAGRSAASGVAPDEAIERALARAGDAIASWPAGSAEHND